MTEEEDIQQILFILKQPDSPLQIPQIIKQRCIFKLETRLKDK